MAASAYLAGKLGDHAVGKTAFALPTNVNISLFVGDPPTGTEVAYTGYARVATPPSTWGAVSAFVGVNGVAITFPAKTTGGDVTVDHWALFDAATGGNMLEYGALATPLTITNGLAPNIIAGTLTRTFS